MTFESFWYLITILIFAGTAVIIVWYLAFERLKRYIKLITVLIVVGVLGALIGEHVALKWNAWVYTSGKNFGIAIWDVPLETLIWAVFVITAISSITLVWSEYEEFGKPVLKTSIKKLKNRLKFFE